MTASNDSGEPNPRADPTRDWHEDEREALEAERRREQQLLDEQRQRE